MYRSKYSSVLGPRRAKNKAESFETDRIIILAMQMQESYARKDYGVWCNKEQNQHVYEYIELVKEKEL